MSWLDPYLLAAVDSFHDLWPRPKAPADKLQQARVISHRGERDGVRIKENTAAAFDPLPGKVWGLECDVRFSRDGVPMIFHDADLSRIYGHSQGLSDLSRKDLLRRFGDMLTLEQLVQRYGGDIHLMIEFKAEPRPQPKAQLQAVAEALAPLKPGEDFHLMALDIPTLSWLAQRWPNALVPIARQNVAEMSRYSLENNCAGMTGHYALLKAHHMNQHAEAGQWAGVGFPGSRNCLRYCLQQGASHLFSNQALTLQSALEREKSESKY